MNKNVFDTSVDIGNGIRNTQLTELNINVNGFPDWFLPSIDELYLMYANLGQNNFGRFGNNLYWSSSHPSYNHFIWAQRFSDGYRQLLNNYTAVRAF